MSDATISPDSSTLDVKPPRVWTVFSAVVLALVLAIFFQAILVIVLALLEVSQGTEPAELAQAITEKITSPYLFILMLLLGQLGFFIAGFVPALRSPQPFRKRIGWVKPRPSWHVYPLSMLGSILVLAVGLASAVAVAKVIPADDMLERLFDGMTVDSAIVFVILIGVVPGIVEEVLFRGYMQRRLVKRWGAVTGITVTSILFALVHGAPPAIAAALPLGFWFGYLAWRRGSILPGIMCHLFVISGHSGLGVSGKFQDLSEATQNIVHGSAIVVGAVCFAICCWPGFWRDRESESITTDVGNS